jgi:hypothetical protein
MVGKLLVTAVVVAAVLAVRGLRNPYKNFKGSRNIEATA